MCSIQQAQLSAPVISIHLENREVTEKNIKNVSFTKVLKEQEEEVISIMADLFDDDKTIFNMFVESEKRQAVKKTEKRMRKQAAVKDRRTAQRFYQMGNSVENIAAAFGVPVKIVEKWLGLAAK